MNCREEFEIVTTEPDRRFRLAVTGNSASLAPGDSHLEAGSDLTLPAEAYIRLVYGRLDPDHIPAGISEETVLATLQSIYSGV